MGFVIVCALGFAAMLKANELWAGVVLFLTLGMLGVSTLGILDRRAAKRAGWVGFTLFGGAYLTISLAPWLSTEILPQLPTTRILELSEFLEFADSKREVELLREQLALEELTYEKLGTKNTIYDPTTPRNLVRDMRVRATLDKIELLKAQINNRVAQQTFGQLPLTTARRKVGHCVFALLIGLIGALIARGFYQTREPAGEGTTV